MAKRNPATLGRWGPDGTRVMAAADMWRQPIKWNAAAEKAGERRRVFCASLADVFEDWQGPILDAQGQRICVYRPNNGVITTLPYVYDPPANCDFMTMDWMRRTLFQLIDRTPWLDWLLLTKRPENVQRMWPAAWAGPDFPGDTRESDGQTFSYYRPNVWLLTSVSDQATADAMIPRLLECRVLCPVLGVSLEPMLGRVDLTNFGFCGGANPRPVTRLSDGWLIDHQNGGARWHPADMSFRPMNGIDFVIIGGESGPGARPFVMDWGAAVLQQCKAAGVAAFMKQVGSNPVGWIDDQFPGGYSALGKHSEEWGPIKDSKGGVMEEWPLHLRVREFPKVSVPA